MSRMILISLCLCAANFSYAGYYTLNSVGDKAEHYKMDEPSNKDNNDNQIREVLSEKKEFVIFVVEQPVENKTSTLAKGKKE